MSVKNEFESGSRPSLLTIYKSFIRPQLHCGSMYDKACNVSFHQNLEKIQCNSVRAITRAIRGTSEE